MAPRPSSTTLVHRLRRRDPRLPRAERRRQDDHHANDRRLYRGHVGTRAPWPATTWRRDSAAARAASATCPSARPSTTRWTWRRTCDSSRGQGSAPRGDARAELDRVTAACRLEAVFRREIYKLSKGYRQRVGLAQALLGQPRYCCWTSRRPGSIPGRSRRPVRSSAPSANTTRCC